MVATCDIFFDKNESAIFLPGELVTGEAILKLDKSKEVKGITLHIVGFAETSWSKSDGDNSTKSLGSIIFYVKLMTYLQGSPDSGNFTIPAGTHGYKFDFQLPYECPTSFEGIHGHIRYEVKISLIRPWKFNHDFTKKFLVIRPIDLNLESPAIKLQANASAEKVFCCGPCRSEPLMLDVTLSRTGFVPGDIIPIQAVISNNSNVQVTGVKVSLMRLVLYMEEHSTFDTTSDQKEVASLRGDGVLRYSKKLFNYSLEVPTTIATNHKTCKIIEITYEVHVEAEVKGPNANQVVAIPVVIGTIPMRAVVTEQPTSSKAIKEKEWESNLDGKE